MVNQVGPGPRVKFDGFCDDVEDYLSMGAIVPLLGTIPAVIKISLGTVQLISAFALGILSAPLRCLHKDLASFNDHCWTHVCHGGGNIVRGFLEGIPIYGTIMILENPVFFGGCKTMPYNSL